MGVMGQTTEQERPDYMSYLLRLWRVDGDDAESDWRASLESSYTGERISFASVEELFAFLRQQTGTGSEPDNDIEAITV
jgi:hypothetical protein